MSMQLVKNADKPAHKPAPKAARVGAAQKHAVSPSAIPDKLYFRIGEVAKLCAVQTYVLRFWESEFPQLRPTKGGTGQRLYRKRDVEMALKIRHLLYDEGFTIPGARQSFQQEPRRGQDRWSGSHENQSELALQLNEQSPLQVKKLKTELRAILGLLSMPVGAPRVMKVDLEPQASAQLFGE